MKKRAEDRKFHFTYRVVCLKTEKVFYGLHSADDLNAKFEGKGAALYMSFKNHGRESHKFERMQVYATRQEAKSAYNELKASELINPIRPESKKFHFLYKTTRFDGKYYIGIHSTDDMSDGYRGSGTYISRSLKKYGWDKHILEILEMCSSRDHAFEREEVTVTPELLLDPLCMNKISGGRQHGGRVYGFTEETRKKLSAKLKEHYTSEAGNETRLKVSEGNRGKIRTREMRAKYSDAKAGIVFTEEHLSKLSAAKKGKPLSDKQREKLSNGQAGKCTIDGITIFASKTKLAKALGHGKNGARSPDFRYIDEARYVQSAEQRQKTRERMLGKPHNWKRV